jgi:hypothetical protein
VRSMGFMVESISEKKRQGHPFFFASKEIPFVPGPDAISRPFW